MRLPNIRKIAKAAAKEKAFAHTFYYEEKNGKGMIIDYNRKLSLEQRLSLLDEFVPLIDNWAICDCCAATYKFTLKNLDEVFKYILKYKNGSEYEVRFVCVMMLDYFLNEEYIDKVLNILLSINRKNIILIWRLPGPWLMLMLILRIR